MLALVVVVLGLVLALVVVVLVLVLAQRLHPVVLRVLARGMLRLARGRLIFK